MLTNTMSSMGFPKDSSKAQITNLDLPLIPIHKDVVTLEIPVDHRWIMAMKVKESSQYLPTPMLHCPYINPPVLLPIPTTK